MLSLWQQRLVSSRSGQSMNFKGKDYIIHVPQCLPGMDKRAKNFCKQRADVFIASHRRFDRAWSMVGIFHTNWQNEVNVMELTLRSFQVSQKNLGSCACANSVYRTLSLIFQVPRDDGYQLFLPSLLRHTMCLNNEGRKNMSTYLNKYTSGMPSTLFSPYI